MSYTVATPGPRKRPATVTAASALLYAIAVIELASIVLSLVSISSVLSVLDEEFAGKPDADIVRTSATVSVIAAVVFSVLFAIGAIVLGVLIGKGKNPARIVTWVLGGIGALCYGCGLVATAASSALTGLGSGTATPEAEEMQRRIQESVPGWQTAISTTVTVLLLLAFIAVIILLAVPASNDFFRKEQEVWVPPTWPADAAGGFPPPPPPPASWPTDPPAPPAGPQG